MNDMIIVTLRSDSFQKDLELPWFVPLSELYPRLLQVLRWIRPSEFNSYERILLEMNGTVLRSMSSTLADYEVSTGTYLDIRRG